MSLRGWQARVGDILESITNAQEYLEGISLEAFRSDKKTMRAVAYKLGIIGEAANLHSGGGAKPLPCGSLGQGAGDAQRHRA